MIDSSISTPDSHHSALVVIGDAEIHLGDCLESLKAMPSESVNCCVTSPPYYGLRDYGCDGQIGLESTPAEYVARLVDVFREVRRVLTDDGTCWVNLGDSYASSPASGGERDTGRRPQDKNAGTHQRTPKIRWSRPEGMKPKDLLGIPWAVATAMRDPYYTGRIAIDRDRAWLAAMIDGEGTICGFHHVRSDDGRPRTGVHVTITNSSTALLDEAARIWPASRSEHDRPGDGHLGSRMTWRWIVHGIENKILLLRELYPYLIVKKRQALVAYNLLLMMADAKRLGHSPQRDAARDRRKTLTDLLSALNKRDDVDVPSWLVAPPSVFEPGWYLRQDVIWAKPNPLPESVRDRCTKSHEYLFLLTKSARYWWDAEAMKEAGTEPRKQGSTRSDNYSESAGRNDSDTHFGRAGFGTNGTRNRRSVWTVATRPYKGAHFAVMPPKLVEPCILAGCPKGGTVIDPFSGSGTVGEVAVTHGRRYIGCELNPEYIPLNVERLTMAQAQQSLDLELGVVTS